MTLEWGGGEHEYSEASLQYLVDVNGKRTHVVLAIEEFEIIVGQKLVATSAQEKGQTTGIDKALVEWKVIARQNGELTFTRDYPFANPSEAVCVGYSR